VGDTGFIVDAFARGRSARPGGGTERTEICLLGRLRDGGTFAIVDDRERPGFFVTSGEHARAAAIAGEGRWHESEMRTLAGEPCYRFGGATPTARARAAEALAASGLRTYEADLRPEDAWRIDRGIHAAVEISGDWRPGRRVTRIYRNPAVAPLDWHPGLSLCSLDIETDVRSNAVLAAGLVHRDCGGAVVSREVLLACEAGAAGAVAGEPLITCVADERALLVALRERILRLDPDVITGWNVVDFDIRMLALRFRAHDLVLDIGRSDEPAVYLERTKAAEGRSLAGRVLMRGRQVWDAVRIVRASGERYEDYTLETVAQAVLGEGKSLAPAAGERRIDALERLAREDPRAFCLYCLRDAELVVRILERTGLDDLTLLRCELTGAPLDRAWTSITTFEHLYIEALHGRGRVAPSRGVDPLPMGGAPGGAILQPVPGLHRDVLVVDFRSLYPSIIRTFNVDPLSYAEASARAGARPVAGDAPPGAARATGLICAPNDACFAREPGILPELLDRFFERRAAARARGDEIASYVYKIIMNSFYGVLGAEGCRFAGAPLAGAVTSLGQLLLGWCRDLLEQHGLRVLYGDTDSLFVTAGRSQVSRDAVLKLVNTELGRYCHLHYGVESHLELEFDKFYSHFFLPRVRGGPEARGRAKGYAGRIGSGDEKGRIEVKGMEAARTDWTPLARRLEIALLELLFAGGGAEQARELLSATIADLRAGRLDGECVYRKRLRKPISAYTASQPPHVRAAAAGGEDEPGSFVSYVITDRGPEPAARRQGSLDYAHYVERQIAPIVSVFAEALGAPMERLLDGAGQLWLF
jgi:DNA polymerase II